MHYVQVIIAVLLIAMWIQILDCCCCCFVWCLLLPCCISPLPLMLQLLLPPPHCIMTSLLLQSNSWKNVFLSFIDIICAVTHELYLWRMIGQVRQDLDICVTCRVTSRQMLNDMPLAMLHPVKCHTACHWPCDMRSNATQQATCSLTYVPANVIWYVTLKK